MKSIKIILALKVLIFYKTVSIAQIELGDTLRQEILSHPKVSSLEYVREYYLFGKTRQEGWSYLSEYIHLQDSAKAYFDTTKYEPGFYHRVGIWLRYDKKGRVIRKDYMPFSDSSEVIEIYYDKKGNQSRIIKYFSYLNPDTIVYKNYNQNTDFVKNYHGIWFYKKSSQIEYEYTICGSKYICGEYKSFYRNGQIRWHCYFDTEGKKIGECTEYYDNGNIKSSGHYSNDLKIGIWNYYNFSGELEKTEEYNSE